MIAIHCRHEYTEKRMTMKSTITFTNNITVENYNALRAAVDWIQVTEKRASIALQHSFICVLRWMENVL